ncbi:helix-turn-helix transcriptional regulator [Nitratireductor sp. XY-223]|uniref:helix-turn-helix domain-containing protein n=1 Tax=Nitratireductor sp. XY-223 TaxID=2561926 RepID=UPI0010AB1916|nr:helix-turn-helix transcriptional regulator [Nitratireductor sp. XY-223]
MSSNAARAFYGQGRSGDAAHPKLHNTLTGISSFEAPATGERFVVVREAEFNAMHEALILAESMAAQSIFEATVDPATHEVVRSKGHNGSAVTQAREFRRISLRQLAARTGLDETYIAGIEDGSRRPTLTAICKIAKVLNVTVDELVTD